MFGKRLHFGVARRFAALPLALLLVMGGLAAPLVSTSRFVELEENSAKNRVEELSHSRINPQRQLRLEAGRITVAPTDLTHRSQGSIQHPIFNALRGHRMPNGLLAPLTC